MEKHNPVEVARILKSDLGLANGIRYAEKIAHGSSHFAAEYKEAAKILWSEYLAKLEKLYNQAGFITDSFLISLTLAAFSIYTVVALYVRSNFSVLESVGAMVGGAL